MRNLLLPILILFLGCADKNSEQNDSLVKPTETWTNFSTKDSIPNELMQTLERIHHGVFDIANSHERFNATDVLIDSLPSRQLLLLSQKGNNWRMAYVQGGFGKYSVYVQCKIEKDSIKELKMTDTFLFLKDNDSIDSYISDGRLQLKNIKTSSK